jgi:hypothetical protein
MSAGSYILSVMCCMDGWMKDNVSTLLSVLLEWPILRANVSV